ncbi:GNAT family N-acetyltransferase [Bacillus testis]|uniref:GNAT family N-acetyltransferase n=1 Tax=Bacillus testis TaxID=1622072 RepID=UPI00067F71E5|nr:GNAT family N-acetyltransferase [Bacillus testis]
MSIYRIEKDQRIGDEAMDLLLLADPSEEMIQSYVTGSTVFQLRVGNELAGIAVCKEMTADSLEIKNIAVGEKHQKKGYGRALLEACIEYGKQSPYMYLSIATGNSSKHQIALYESCGFLIHHIEKDYFIKHYPEPIYENGIQCCDKVVLRRHI